MARLAGGLWSGLFKTLIFKHPGFEDRPPEMATAGPNRFISNTQHVSYVLIVVKACRWRGALYQDTRKQLQDNVPLHVCKPEKKGPVGARLPFMFRYLVLWVMALVI
jgi:hypothetical protein